MIIVLLGASGSGKSTIENELIKYHGFKKIIPYTTRKPRGYEFDGSDYFFINNKTFHEMIKSGLFAEYNKYPQERWYGTLISDYSEGNKIVVLTPNGLRQIKKTCQNNDIFTVFVDSNLGTRIKRYINRCGVDRFSFDDKNEIANRTERDYGMFAGVEDEVDLVIHNNEETNIIDLVNEIFNKYKALRGCLN